MSRESGRVPLDRAALERVLAKVNADRRTGQEARLEAFEPGRFALSFFDAPMAEGRCIDEHFTEVQFELHAREKVDTTIVGARFDDAASRYRVDYEVIEW